MPDAPGDPAHYGFGPESMRKVKVCSFCGAACSSSEDFCRECGKPLPFETLFQSLQRPGRRCEACGASIPAAALYCPACGVKL